MKRITKISTLIFMIVFLLFVTTIFIQKKYYINDTLKEGNMVYMMNKSENSSSEDVLIDPIVSNSGNGDNIPDDIQYIVKYEVQNGTFNFEGQANLSKVETVLTRRDNWGTPSAEGIAKLSEAHIAIGVPNPNYGNGRWYVKETGTDGLGIETEHPYVGTIIPGNITYTVVYSKVIVDIHPNGGEWTKSLPSNWKEESSSGVKESELNNERLSLPSATDITKGKMVLTMWKGSDENEYAPGAEIKPIENITLTAQWAGIEIEKTATLNGQNITEDTKVGLDDKITYIINVKNSGDIDLYNVVVADPMLPDFSNTIGDLTHGESKKITYDYIVKQVDIDAGKIYNVATVKGYGMNGVEPDDISELTINTFDLTYKEGEYKIEWYDKNTNELIKDSEIRTGIINEIVEVIDEDKIIEGYTFDADNKNNILSTTLNGNNTILRLYFTKEDNKDKINVIWWDGYTENPLKNIEIAPNENYDNLYPKNPIREGYEFVEWGEPQIDSDGNINITAEWKYINKGENPITSDNILNSLAVLIISIVLVILFKSLKYLNARQSI